TVAGEHCQGVVTSSRRIESIVAKGKVDDTLQAVHTANPVTNLLEQGKQSALSIAAEHGQRVVERGAHIDKQAIVADRNAGCTIQIVHAANAVLEPLSQFELPTADVPEHLDSV